MPKCFQHIIRFFLLAAPVFNLAHAACTENRLCPEPLPESKPAIILPHPDAETYRAAMQNAVAQASTLDWVIDKTADNHCGGYFLVPENPNPQRLLSPEQSDLIMSSDRAEQDEEGFTRLEGDVQIYHGSRRLRSDLMLYKRETGYSELSGNIQLREPGLLLLSEKASLDETAQTSVFEDTRYVLYAQQAHGKAGKITLSNIDNKAYLTLRDTDFSLCPPSADYWSFNAKRLEIDHDKGWGKLYSASFEIGDVPVFYLPYLDFPVDDRRKTGFLWPTISSANGSGGIDIALPYYINLAPQADMTYIPRYQAGHGYLHGIETRYLHRFSEWQIGGTYIQSDNRIGDIDAADDKSLDTTRWLGFIQEEGRFNKHWSTSIDYQAVSDKNYFRDWGTVGLDVKRTLKIRREAELAYHDADWAVESRIVDYQSLVTDPATGDTALEEYRQLPSVKLYYKNRQRPMRLEPVFDGEYTFFDHEEKIRGQRLYGNAGLSFPLRWSFLDIIPAAGIKHTHFILNNSNEADETAFTGSEYEGKHDTHVPYFSLDNRLYLERDITLGDEQHLQSVTPRLFYYYADYAYQDDKPLFDATDKPFRYRYLFSENRFSSPDRLSDENKLSLALETAIINKNDGSLDATLAIGQTHYFADRRVSLLPTDRQTLALDGSESNEEKAFIKAWNAHINKYYQRNNSDIAIEGKLYIDQQQSLSGMMVWDPYDTETTESAVGYHYHGNAGHLFNMAYRHKRDLPYLNADNALVKNRVEQMDVSMYLPVNKTWDVYFRWQYDMQKNHTIEDISGLRYEGCCFAVMFAYQRERKSFENNRLIKDTAPAEYNYNWLIQFELKGLGGVTNSITRLLEESIQGFGREH